MSSSKRLTQDRDTIDRIIRASQVCRLGMAVDGEPYLVPLSFGFDGQAVYIHTAQEGRKLEFFERNPRVCLEFENAVRLVRDDPNPCAWSFAFESVIGYGRISELLEPSAKARGLRQVILHYAGEEVPFPPEKLSSVRVWRVTIESLSAKRAHLSPE